MTLSNLLSEGQILPSLQATERWEAIAALVDMLVETGKIAAGDREIVLESIRQREQTMSTGIGLGIAIPHASTDRVTEVVAAFGRSQAGIDFDSLDGNPVHFIVLFVVPKDQFQTHLRTLSAIAKFLNDPAVRKNLTEAQTTADIYAVFAQRTAQQ